jgi:hypothetical protein
MDGWRPVPGPWYNPWKEGTRTVMYMARIRRGGRWEYRLRQSIPSPDGRWIHEDLYALGPDPSGHIVYPGGNGFYFDPLLTETLTDLGINDPDRELERVFLPFLAPNIRRVVTQMTRLGRRRRVAFSSDAMERLQAGLHPFDKRRLYFLRNGRSDPDRLVLRTQKCYNLLLEKSRDEMESVFETLESDLNARERKAYVFFALNLGRGFAGAADRASSDALDEAFLREICRLAQDATYLGSHPDASVSGLGLTDALIRYVILWFDHDFEQISPRARAWEEFTRFHRMPPKPPVDDLARACRVFALSLDEFRTLSRSDLGRLYRKKALETHPDLGGDPDDFVALGLAYERLVEAKGA